MQEDSNTKEGSSGNGDPSLFIQSGSKPVPTTEIQAGSHNGDPN